MKRVLLISMPFATTGRPSIGLSLLKAGLNRDGIECDIRYVNVEFAQCIGHDTYERICNFSTDPLLGEWIFAEDVFGAQLRSAEQYFQEVLLPCLAEPFRNGLGDKHFQSPAELLDGLIQLRRNTSDFLESCTVSDDYGLIGFTSTFQQNLASLAMARRLKERRPEIPIMFGGANCESEMGATLHRLFPFIDYICSGEGDLTFSTVARAILNGEPVPELPGIIRRVSGHTVTPTQLTAPVLNMDSLPIPDYSDYIHQHTALKSEEITGPQLLIETARGCWWGAKSHCTFCGLNGSTMQFRAKSPTRAIEELRILSTRYGSKRIAAVDNIIDMRYFREVIPHLAALDMQLELFYETKANLRKDQVKLMRDAGIVQIQPGIESLSSNILGLMRKGVSALQNIQLLRWCAEYMVRPGWNLLAGFPGEDPAEYHRQAEIVPLLTHLPPPIHVTMVRLDRFSPLFVEAGSNGITNVRASHAHSFIYPFSGDDLASLAYYFDFDYADGRHPESYVAEFRDAVEVWKSQEQNGQLISLRDGNDLFIFDTRPIATQPEFRLDGVKRIMYEYFDHAHTRRELATYLLTMADGLTATPNEVDRVLVELETAKLLLREGERYLSLAVSGDFQVGYLADHLKSNTPLPDHTRHVIMTLYESQPELVRSLIAERMVEPAQVA